MATPSNASQKSASLRMTTSAASSATSCWAALTRPRETLRRSCVPVASGRRPSRRLYDTSLSPPISSLAHGTRRSQAALRQLRLQVQRARAGRRAFRNRPEDLELEAVGILRVERQARAVIRLADERSRLD